LDLWKLKSVSKDYQWSDFMGDNGLKKKKEAQFQPGKLKAFVTQHLHVIIFLEV
jgi:hypothetical protein